MSVWMKNLRSNLENKEVIILYGNVRDKYIDPDRGIIYENLTDMIKGIRRELGHHFDELVFYDPVGQERKQGREEKRTSSEFGGGGELESTSAQREKSTQKIPPARVLAKWANDLSSASGNILATIFYLDKVVGYKASYTQEDRELILRLEKLIENITPNNRLILVALQDTMIPVELYTNSPKTHIVPIPIPDSEDRRAYLGHRLGNDFRHLELVADLTDGLFLRDLDNIVIEVKDGEDLGEREIRKVINKYRIGEQEDYWGALDIRKLDNARHWFTVEQGVKGQDMAVERVIDTLCLARTGLSGVASGTASKPRGVLFFSGPTGVGKTFLAKKLALFLFNSEDAFIRFDMSEFKEEHTVSKLIGSPPGYVGYERGGMLTNSVREKPFSVILFDEVEKAHFKILDIFLQILDEGRLTDSRGQTVFFTETIIIFTSNIGTRTHDSRGNSVAEKAELDEILKNGKLDEGKRKEQVSRHFVQAVEQFFMFEISRPELLNRIGNNIVPFGYIDSGNVQREIIQSHLRRIKEDVEDRYRSAGMKLEFDESVIQYLIEKYGEKIARFGGRGITNAINDEIMMTVAKSILKAEHLNRMGAIHRVVERNGAIRVLV